MSAALMLTVELLAFAPESPRTTALFEALRAAAPAADIACHRTTAYGGQRDWLMLWGPGAPNRFAPMRAHLAAGGRVIAWDAAYWARARKLRVSIDAAHPPAWVLRYDWPATRWQADPAAVRSTWRPDGPIVLAGIGAKARVQYGAATVDAWEAEMIAACRARWPARPIWYRSKRGERPVPAGAVAAPAGDIDQVIAGASLVVTWHSNVAVDAIRMGVPTVCRDGAAAAVSPCAVPDDPRPLPASARDRFLHNLAWFQWDPAEAAETWRFLRALVPA